MGRPPAAVENDPRTTQKVWVDRMLRVEKDEQGQAVPVMDVMVRFLRERPKIRTVVTIKARPARAEELVPVPVPVPVLRP